MAHFIGQTGAHLAEKALNRRLNLLLATMMAYAGVCFIMGALAGYAAGHRGGNRFLLLTLLTIALTVLAFRYYKRRVDAYLRLARSEETGAAGERDILSYLRKLPDAYTVVSDLDFAESYGNIDHLVIGPTGLFSIDVKNWKGAVSADGRGELLLNGKPTDKPQVRAFTARTMDLKDRLKTLTRLDPYIQCLFVFPHTYIEARWGATGTVLCLHADQLVDFLTKPNPSRAIPPADLPRLVAAAKALKDTIAKPQPLAAPGTPS